MAQTITTKTPLNVVRMATGAYLDTGTVAAYTISDLGFKPRYVRVINTTSGDEECFIEGMTDAHAYKRVAAGTGAAITSLGITPTSRGFTFGLDTDMNVTSEQVRWVAFG
jgi:hypothetical protein